MPKSPPKSKILIADDNDSDVSKIKTCLAEVDCEIAVSANHDETLKTVAEFHPHLLLLDVTHHKRDGYDLVRTIKHDPAISRTSILAISTFVELHEVEQAVDAGIDDFLFKPIDSTQLLKRVELLLALNNSRS